MTLTPWVSRSMDLMAAWCDDFQRAMTWLCSPEATVTIPLKEYERLRAGYNPSFGQHMAGRSWLQAHQMGSK